MIKGDKEDKFCTKDQSDCTVVGGNMDETQVCIIKLNIYITNYKLHIFFTKLIEG